MLAIGQLDNPIRLSGGEQVQISRLNRVVVLRVAEQNRIAKPLRNLFNAAYAAGQDRICNIGHQYDDQLRLLGPQAPGHKIWTVPQSLNHPEHLFPGGFRNPVGIANCPRNCGDRDASGDRDVTNTNHGSLRVRLLNERTGTVSARHHASPAPRQGQQPPSKRSRLRPILPR